MYEELSRLLAGELDATSEARLRARIAADPALARAWAELSALPDLLGGLAFDAPPPALAARMADMALDIDAELAPFADELRDPADETMDPEAEVLRPSHPVRARAMARAPATEQGREAFLDRLLTEARADAAPWLPEVAPRLRSVPPPVRPDPVLHDPVRSPGPAPRAAAARRIGVTMLVGAMAMAAGLVLGLQAPAAPSAPHLATEVAVSEGTTTVDGSVDLRAGDVHVRVDGRARVTVQPDWFASREPGASTVVVVGGSQPASVAVAAPVASAAPRFVGTTAAFAPSAAATAADTDYVATVGPTASAALAAPRTIVTIEVERGAAIVDPTGAAVTVEAGESRTFDPRGVEVVVPGLAVTEPNPVGSALPPLATVEGHQSRREVVTLGGDIVRPGADPDGQLTPANEIESGPPEAYGLLSDEEDYMATALDAVPGTGLLDIDCTFTPCVFVFDYEGADPAWREHLGEALSAELAVGLTITGSEVAVEGWSVGLLAVSVDEGTPEGAVVHKDDEHARKALHGIERELTE